MTHTTLTPHKPIHAWLRTAVPVAFVREASTPVLDQVIAGLRGQFERLGHLVQAEPTDDTALLLSTAVFGETIDWRRAVLFGGRRKHKVSKSTAVITLMHITGRQFEETLRHFETALAKSPPDPADFSFPALAPTGWPVLVEQGLRGGPIMALERLAQAQAKSIRIVLIVGDDRPTAPYHFDLVGAYPRTDADDLEAFYADIIMRLITTISTFEVTQHEAVGAPIARAEWDRLAAPAAMQAAGVQLSQRTFFTDMIRVSDFVQVPAVSEAVASQYSEGCYATWEPAIDGLIATVTGSARPVDKGHLSEEDLAVIVGVRPDGLGARVRHVDGKLNAAPSSEAVEMMAMNDGLPTVQLEGGRRVPVIRSRLHGHRGVGGFDPARVEYVPLDPPYYHYLVSCATQAQAQGIQGAFVRSETLRNPDDPRQVAFTVLPGHGCMIVEKWVAGKEPFQVIWEYMDQGFLQVENRIPQGPMEYVPGPDERMVIRAEWGVE